MSKTLILSEAGEIAILGRGLIYAGSHRRGQISAEAMTVLSAEQMAALAGGRKERGILYWTY